MTRPREKCKYCGTPMDVVDVDYQFKGCEDRWYYCPKCNGSLIVCVRYNKIVRKSYFIRRTENDKSDNS